MGEDEIWNLSGKRIYPEKDMGKRLYCRGEKRDAIHKRSPELKDRVQNKPTFGG